MHLTLPDHPSALRENDLSLLALKNITFAFQDGNNILDGLNLDISCPDRLGIIGSNGSGKTTLLSVIMGLEQAQCGQILFNGEQVETREDWGGFRKKVGFVFQNSDDQLFMPTVLEDVTFGPLNMGLSADQARQKAIRTLTDLGLHGFEHRITHKLSGGEKRLVALATVLVMDPKIIMLDEPTNDLDPATRLRLIEILHDLPQTLVLVSHDWDFLHNTTNCLYLLEKGTLVPQNSDILHTHVHSHPAGQTEHAHNRNGASLP